jgi:hypothetical protein
VVTKPQGVNFRFNGKYQMSPKELGLDTETSWGFLDVLCVEERFFLYAGISEYLGEQK